MESLKSLTKSLLNYGNSASPETEEVLVNGDVDAPDAGSDPGYADGVNRFVMAFFRQVSWTKTGFKDNFLLAPVSVYATLAIMHLGAKGHTKAELESALHLSSGAPERAAQLYRDFRKGLVNELGDYTLGQATKLYHDPGMRPCAEVLASLDSAVERINFRDSPNQAREIINQWVEDHTENHIAELIPPGPHYIREETRMVIVSATYFRGRWATPFDRRATTERDFFVRPDLKVPIDTMQQTGTFLFASDPELECTALELPYVGARMSMIFLLPEPKTYLEYLIAKLSTEHFEGLYSRLKSTLVKVALPRFTIGQSAEVTEHVKALGVKDLFDRDRAKLPGFNDDDDRGFFASFVLHKAVIGATEEGTMEPPRDKTSHVGLVRRSSSVNKKQPKEFIVNRPFAFFLYDEEARAIVFTGLIRDPTKKN